MCGEVFSAKGCRGSWGRGKNSGYFRTIHSVVLWFSRRFNQIIKQSTEQSIYPILQGNHGEDVKELYYHLDATPTWSYAKALYKYPQGEYPYARINEGNQSRGKEALEFEVDDTGMNAVACSVEFRIFSSTISDRIFLFF
jgi:hypothetical protein